MILFHPVDSYRYDLTSRLLSLQEVAAKGQNEPKSRVNQIDKMNRCTLRKTEYSRKAVSPISPLTTALVTSINHEYIYLASRWNCVCLVSENLIIISINTFLMNAT